MGESTITEKEDPRVNYRLRMNRFSWERIQSIIIVILVIVILLMQQCNGGNKEVIEPKVITETITVWDTLEIEKEVYVPKWRTKVVKEYDTIEVKVLQEVDTLSILDDYYSEYVYKDTISLDTIGYISLIDTISKNSILSREPNIQIQIPTKTIKETIYINNREFYAGFGVRSNGQNMSWMGLEGVMRSKNGNTFVLGLGTDNENNFSLGGSVHWRIGDK